MKGSTEICIATNKKGGLVPGAEIEVPKSRWKQFAAAGDPYGAVLHIMASGARNDLKVYNAEVVQIWRTPARVYMIAKVGEEAGINLDWIADLGGLLLLALNLLDRANIALGGGAMHSDLVTKVVKSGRKIAEQLALGKLDGPSNKSIMKHRNDLEPILKSVRDAVWETKKAIQSFDQDQPDYEEAVRDLKHIKFVVDQALSVAEATYARFKRGYAYGNWKDFLTSKAASAAYQMMMSYSYFIRLDHVFESSEQEFRKITARETVVGSKH